MTKKYLSVYATVAFQGISVEKNVVLHFNSIYSNQTDRIEIKSFIDLLGDNRSRIMHEYYDAKRGETSKNIELKCSN